MIWCGLTRSPWHVAPVSFNNRAVTGDIAFRTRAGARPSPPSCRRVAEIDRAGAVGPLEIGLDRVAGRLQPGAPRRELVAAGGEAQMPRPVRPVRRHRQARGECPRAVAWGLNTSSTVPPTREDVPPRDARDFLQPHDPAVKGRGGLEVVGIERRVQDRGEAGRSWHGGQRTCPKAEVRYRRAHTRPLVLTPCHMPDMESRYPITISSCACRACQVDHAIYSELRTGAGCPARSAPRRQTARGSERADGRRFQTEFVRDPSALRQNPALVLNADYRPLSYYPLSLWPWQDAIKAVYLDRVDIVAEYEDTVRSPTPRYAYRASSCSRTMSNPGSAWPSRASIFFCGTNFPASTAARKGDLTFDHVVPRARGGTTNWENVVAACSRCNLRKGARACGGRHEPAQGAAPPGAEELRNMGRKFPPNHLHESWIDFLYASPTSRPSRPRPITRWRCRSPRRCRRPATARSA